MENGNLNAYPDLIVYKNNGAIQLVKFERNIKKGFYKTFFYISFQNSFSTYKWFLF